MIEVAVLSVIVQGHKVVLFDTINSKCYKREQFQHLHIITNQNNLHYMDETT